ncbi:MAG: arylsulfotransferase family protein [Solirubrobacteraceae bacterium]
MVLIVGCLLAALLIAAWLSGHARGGSDRPSRVATTLAPRSRILDAADRLSVREPQAVSVFPIPGTRYNLPGTQISFRGIAPRRIGPLRIVGSVTGVHVGRIAADSDRRGGSFIPSRPFAAGETVRVVSKLRVLGGHRGEFSFGIEAPAPQISPAPLRAAAAGAHGVQRFSSRPDLRPAAVTVDRDSPAQGARDIFVAPQDGPVQDGPMILGPHGNLIWSHPSPVGSGLLTTDFRVQRLRGRPVLTWWQGYQNRGSGRGVGVIFNCHYRRIATVHAGNGLDADLHEFLVTNSGDAYLIAASPVTVPGSTRPLIDSVIQEIDIKTGLVLFEWHALDHVKLSESYKYGSGVPGHVVDPYHMNSISITPDGNLIVSMHNTSATYKIDRRSGQIIWRLGGKDSSFALPAGTSTAFQHDVIVHAGRKLTIFDNGAGPPKMHASSRGLELKLDPARASVKVLGDYDHSPPLSANFEGSIQALPGGHMFLGYGQRPYFTEFDAHGREVFDAHFTAHTTSYRAYRVGWLGEPLTRPAVAVRRTGRFATVYASWNGATRVARWRVMAGRTANTMRAVAAAARRGFETPITIRTHADVAVVALDSSGRVLSRSRTVRLH